MKFFQNKQQSGFTLIEVMVSVSIFAIITVIGISALLVTNTAYKQSRAQQRIIDNLSFVLDSMAREFFTGYDFRCGTGLGTDCYLNPATRVSFTNQYGEHVAYSLSPDFRILRTDLNEEHGLAGGVQPMSSESVEVKNLDFLLRGASSQNNDAEQVFIGIVIDAVTELAGQEQPVSLQTSVSPRILDVPVGA